ncbi:hypothetical protein [Amycolatopsis panacis]|uniref:LppX_LprAFG lipoprotein n=1 Tax=Amycolatopsis panacis TaxID=2340917 RepID=A0A419I0K7_9PSEU|nr:hypothetical protein [Amycolatopsis panacis]RJQ83135.1 hypothetical protein D5S19_21040 [Amycolatopsis panacis]
MRRTAVAGAVVVLAAALAGCSDDEPQRFADARTLADAATAATLAGRSAEFTTDVAAGTFVSHGTGQARFDPSGTALKMTTDYVGEPLELRLVNRALYAKVPAGARDQVTGGKPWVQVSPDGNDPLSQVLGGSLTQLAEQNDPGRTLAQVRTAGTLTTSEQARLGDAPVEHYRLTVDLAKLGSELPAGLPADAMAQLGGHGATVPLDLWLDPQHRPVQLVLDLSPVLQATGETGDARITARYSGWGSPVTVDPPPAAEVGTLAGG